MCGIAGAINLKVPKDIVFDSLKHRGPDEFGSFRFENIELFHTRLSIQDINGGHQPMELDEYVIVFNGEIYNHLELRQEYLSEVDFKTHSDTETLLHLYKHYKRKIFSMLDGMFALAILDRKSKTLLLAVDRAGKKPLFYYKDGKHLFFASELNSINQIIKPQIDEEAIISYLRCGFFPKTLTPYQNVNRIENGVWQLIDLENLNIKQESYFCIKEIYKKEPFKGDRTEAKRVLESYLKESIKRRLLSSDLEVGAFLSGGIDSSLVVAMASEYTKELKTFTVSFEGAYDEAPLAKLTADRYNTHHHTLDISLNLKRDIEKILGSYGMPFADSSAIPSWYVSKSAKEYVTVVLNGDGADELFGGYRRYVPFANSKLFKTAKLISPLVKLLPPPQEKRSYYNYLYRLLNLAKREGLDRYLSATSDIFEGYYRFPSNSYLKELDQEIDSCTLSELNNMLCLDFELLLFGDLLVKMDIATMAHSLEARSPFLAKEILEFAPTLPSDDKIAKTTTKSLLRELSKDYLPTQLISQPKRGFEVPLKSWVNGILKNNIKEALSSGSYSEQFIDREWLNKLLDDKLNIPAEKRAKMLWSMYALEVWKAQV